MRFAVLATFAVAGVAQANPGPPERSLRPELRPELHAITVQGASNNRGLQRWISDFRARASAQGISTQAFDAAFRGVRYNADVIQRDRNQSEFTKTIWEYLDSAASDLRVRNGLAALRQNEGLLNAIEARSPRSRLFKVAMWRRQT